MSARLGVLGGYLGSGKSTVVNRLLTGAALGRTAVVVNDFGSVNIDADLIASADEDTLELTNGCICCQATDDTARVMRSLAAREDLDYVLCEVSGVGDPGQLASWRSFPGLLPGPVVVCADATRIISLLRDEYVGDTVRRQLASAEVVVITKTDLVGTDEAEEARAACRAVTDGEVVLQPTSHPEETLRSVFAGPRAGAVTTDSHEQSADRHPDTHRSETMRTTGRVDLAGLRRLLTEEADHLARAKGIVHGPRGDWYEIHLAGGRLEMHPLAADRPTPASSTLVLIAAGAGAERTLERVRSALLPLFP